MGFLKSIAYNIWAAQKAIMQKLKCMINNESKYNTTDLNFAMQAAAEHGYIETVKLCKERGATDFDGAMTYAACKGHIDICKLCKQWGATRFGEAMCAAACNGRIDIVKLCKEWGATNFDSTMRDAAWYGYPEIVKLCKEWGATDFDSAMREATLRGHASKIRGALGFDKIHMEIFYRHYKKKYYKNLVKELLPITWHPDRVWDWCFDEDQKQTVVKNFTIPT